MYTLMLKVEGGLKIIGFLEILQYPIEKLWMASISSSGTVKIY